MLLKLSLAGMKGKLKDYFVLLSGLVMTISVFYMFQTLSWNTEFIKSNAMIRNIQLVFIVGSVLLSVVTILYMLYTNTFLLSLRQKEFGMYMMLGAKKKSIKKIMFVETMVIGATSLVIGITVGIGLAFVVGYLLAGQLNITLEGYQSFYLPSVLATFVFFIIVFLFTALINHIKLSRVQVLQLIYSDVHPDEMPIQKKKNIWLILHWSNFLKLRLSFLNFHGAIAGDWLVRSTNIDDTRNLLIIYRLPSCHSPTNASQQTIDDKRCHILHICPTEF